MISLEELIARTPDLPTIPAAAIRVMREADSNTATASSVAEALIADQSLSVRVLRLANSPYYGLIRRVSDLTEAVVILGMRNIRNLAMVASTYTWMVKPLTGYALGPKQLWTHAMATALGAQMIAERAKVPHPDFCFTAGLLHDIGKLALSIWIESKLPAMNTYAEQEKLPFHVVERRLLGYDHAEVGAQLATDWNLPDSLVRVIRYHHEPSESLKPEQSIDCVHIADYLSMSFGMGIGGDGLLYCLDDNAIERLHLDADDLDEIANAFMEEVERYKSLFEELQLV